MRCTQSKTCFNALGIDLVVLMVALMDRNGSTSIPVKNKTYTKLKGQW